MEFRTRKMIQPADLNAHNTLFGGQMLRWIDEEAAIYATCQLGTSWVVTKFISEVNFVSPARQGDVVEIGMDVVKIGNTSITLRCEVRNKNTKRTIVAIERIVFVSVNEEGRPVKHGKNTCI